MSGAAIAEYLASRRYLVVATTRADGRPHVAPSAFLLAAERFWLPVTAGTVRERNVRRSSYVSLVLAEGDDADHKAVLSEGPAEVVAAPEDRVAAEWTRRQGPLPEWATGWIVVSPEKLFTYDAGLPEAEVLGWTCEACGDSFTTHTGEAPKCPSCGSGSARMAAEPFL